MKHFDATEDVIMIKRPSFLRPCSFPSLRWLTCLGVATAFLTIANGAVAQQRYNTPDAAVTALIEAVRGGAPALLTRVLGPGSDERRSPRVKPLKREQEDWRENRAPPRTVH
jgi:hypothetical protein